MVSERGEFLVMATGWLLLTHGVTRKGLSKRSVGRVRVLVKHIRVR